MSTQYIDPTLLDIDEIVEQAIDKDTMDRYYDKIDKQVEMLCQSKGVPASTIPVDGSGHVTSLVLESVAVNYGLYIICRGYAGSGNGNVRDVYGAKSVQYYEDYKEALKHLTKDTIEGGDGEAELPLNGFYQNIQIEY